MATYSSMALRLVQQGSDAIPADYEPPTPLHRAAQTGRMPDIEKLARKTMLALQNNKPSSFVDVLTCLREHTPVHEAARFGHAEAIELLVGINGEWLDKKNNMGLVPLHLAVEHRHLAAIQTLLRLGSRALGICSIYRPLPLHYAAMLGFVDVIETIVRLDGDAPKMRDEYECTALHFAVESDSAEVIETLVRLGSPIDARDRLGQTPMYYAASDGHVSVIETLVRLGSQAIDTPDGHGETPFASAASWGQVSTIETLIRLGSKAIDTADVRGETPLHRAASCGCADVVKTLIRLGSTRMETTNVRDQTPLIAALSDCRFGWSLRDRNLRDPATSAEMLMALGANRPGPDYRWSSRTIGLRDKVLDEDEVADIRYEVYFSTSLTSRLVKCLVNTTAALRTPSKVRKFD